MKIHSKESERRKLTFFIEVTFKYDLFEQQTQQLHILTTTTCNEYDYIRHYHIIYLFSTIYI